MKALSRCESLLRDLDAACAVTLQTTLAGVLNFLEEFGARNANIVVRARLAVRFGVGVELLSMFSNILSLSFCVLGRLALSVCFVRVSRYSLLGGFTVTVFTCGKTVGQNSSPRSRATAYGGPRCACCSF